jgi:hypothetical protein
MTTPPSRTLLITRVEDEISKGLGKGARGEGFEAFVQALVDGGNGGSRDGVAAQPLGDRLDLAGRDALLGSSPGAGSHLGERRHRRLLGALITPRIKVRGSVENRPSRSCGTRSSNLPTRVTRVREQ